MSGKPPLDFDVVREPWNKYELADGAVVKVKLVVVRIKKNVSPDGKSGDYGFKVQSIAVAMSPEHGPPDTRAYSPEELAQAVTKEDIRYTTASEEWNEYVTDDGARLRIKNTLVRVAKTSKFDADGEPLYITETNAMAQLKLPTPG